MAGQIDNTNNKKHGAFGLEKRIYDGLALRIDDQKERLEIQAELGYDVLPSGPLGIAVELIADNVLIARRFRSARQWAIEQGDREAYEKLQQRSGWRNDKAVTQLLNLFEMQKEENDALDYEQMLRNNGNG